MQYSGLSSFIDSLEKSEELLRIKTYADPVLEITEITDRVAKSGGKALLFENNGTAFPLLINAYGSDKRMAMAIGQQNIEEALTEISDLMERFTSAADSFLKKIRSLPDLLKISGYLP